MQYSIPEIAKALRLSPEEYQKKLDNNTLNLRQITIVSKCMGITPEQTVKMFFPRFMYRKSLTKRNGGALCHL